MVHSQETCYSGGDLLIFVAAWRKFTWAVLFYRVAGQEPEGLATSDSHQRNLPIPGWLIHVLWFWCNKQAQCKVKSLNLFVD